jgi:hypothetical protein
VKIVDQATGMIGDMSGISDNHNAANAELSHRYLYPPVSHFLQNIPPSVVMDAGWGNGSFLSLFQDRNWQLHGSDLSPSGIEIARKTFPKINFFFAGGKALTQALQETGFTNVEFTGSGRIPYVWNSILKAVKPV